MAIWVGTSGYQYPEWRGSFYPEKFPTAKMLPYYAERFSSVEALGKRSEAIRHLRKARALYGRSTSGR